MVKKQKIRYSTLWTGLRDKTTINALNTERVASIQKGKLGFNGLRFERVAKLIYSEASQKKLIVSCERLNVERYQFWYRVLHLLPNGPFQR